MQKFQPSKLTQNRMESVAVNAGYITPHESLKVFNRFQCPKSPRNFALYHIYILISEKAILIVNWNWIAPQELILLSAQKFSVYQNGCVEFASVTTFHFISIVSSEFIRLLVDCAGRAAAAKVQELGLSRGNRRVQFAQLKGMADVLSLSLVHAGFRVSKVLPFGSVSEFIPFIVRRAEENRGLLGNTVTDRQYLRYVRPGHFEYACTWFNILKKLTPYPMEGLIPVYILCLEMYSVPITDNNLRLDLF